MLGRCVGPFRRPVSVPKWGTTGGGSGADVEHMDCADLRRLMFLAAVISVVLSMVVASGAYARTTEVSRFEPFDAFGEVDPSLHLASRYGNCWTGSLVSTRDDAWRCM